jgi:hypothetical protein
MSMIGSFRTGTTSVLTGQGSTPTAAGVCAPFPGLFLTDGASFKTGTESVLTASEPPPCGDGCAAGQTIFDQTFADVVEVASSAVATPPTYGVYEIPVGSFADCPNFRLSITADCAWLGETGGIRNGGAIHAYLNASGMDLATRAFTSGAIGDQLANIPANESDNSYRSYTFVVYPAATPAYNDFAGPLASQSVYLWCPVFFPDFTEGDWHVKNVHVQIVTV